MSPKRDKAKQIVGAFGAPKNQTILIFTFILTTVIIQKIDRFRAYKTTNISYLSITLYKYVAAPIVCEKIVAIKIFITETLSKNKEGTETVI